MHNNLREPRAYPLRWFALWRGLGWALVITVVILSLTPSVPGGASLGDHFGHTLAYAVLAFWFGILYPRTTATLFAVGFALMGLVLEVLQDFSAFRTFQWLDLVANLLGVSLGWILARTALGRLLYWAERILPVL